MNNDIKKLAITIFLSAMVLIGWHFVYERPRIIKNEQIVEELKQKQRIAVNQTLLSTHHNEVEAKPEYKEKSIAIKNEILSGAISTKGLKIEELSLLKYKQSLDQGSKPVELLSLGDNQYFVEFGFISKDNIVEVPTSNTVWFTENNILEPKSPVTFKWKNKQNIEFINEISVDENYLFTIRQKIKNHTANQVVINSYGRINRQVVSDSKAISVSHEGAVGVLDQSLKEITYGDLQDNGKVIYSNVKKGWFGLSDKYWLTAIIPDDRYSFTSNFIGFMKDGREKFQVDYLSEDFEIAAGAEKIIKNFLYAGAKELDLIDGYQNTQNFELFDRAVDFGWFYFITKPLYITMKFFYDYLHNYGLAIIAITLLIKLLMFPLANKSFRSMNKMKKLQPDLERIKELYGKDQIKLNSEMMALYKKHNVSPLSGCLPLLVQIPVFFSLYKVINISIDMRQAPFYGWLKDLSIPDPTSITNLFGLLPYAPLPYLTIGVLPILMCATMFIQQQLSPAPADPVQAKVMKFLPLIFLFLFSGFPSGLLLYWTFSNVISILQQLFLLKYSNNDKK